MDSGVILPLATISAIRPVFMIVMGLFLMVIAWRLAKSSHGWTGRFIMAGSLLLGFGYMILMPMYEAGVIEGISPRGIYRGSEATAMAWQCVKMVVMNGGWLLFGLGMAMHAKVFAPAAPRRELSPPAPLATHESAA